MKLNSQSQADGSAEKADPSSFTDMSDTNESEVQRSLGRIEGKLDIALPTLTAHGKAIQSLQEWRARSMGYLAGVSFVMGLLGAVAFNWFK